MHCGHKVLLKDSMPQRIVIDNSDKVKNWIILGKAALGSANYDSTEDYANKILEHNAEIGIAWFFKGCSAIHDSARIFEACDCWNKSSELMTLDEKKENFEEFLYEITSWDKVFWDEVDAGISSVEDRSSEDWSIRDEEIELTIVNYLSGFDDECLCSMYREGADFLFEASAKEDINKYNTMYYASNMMFELSIEYDNDCRSIHDSYKKLYMMDESNRKKTIENYKYDSTDLKLLFIRRNIRKNADKTLEYYRTAEEILSNIVSCYSDDDRAAALKYWSENKERRNELNDEIAGAYMDFLDSFKKIIGGTAAKKKAAESIKTAYMEIAYPKRR